MTIIQSISGGLTMSKIKFVSLFVLLALLLSATVLGEAV